MFEEKSFDNVIEDAKLIAISKLPFISMQLSDMIVSAREGIGTMATDSVANIYYDPKYEKWVEDAVGLNLDHKQYYVALTIVHEIFHKIQRDNIFFRMIGEGGIHELYNIAADSYINDIIIEFFETTDILSCKPVEAFKERCVTTRSLLNTIKKYDTKDEIDISFEELSLCTTVERYNLLLKASEEHRETLQKALDEIMEQIGGGDLIEGDGDGKPTPGEGQAGKDGITVPGEIADAIKSGMIKTTTAMLNKINSIGKSSANFENIVGELLEPKVDWNTKLVRLIRQGSQKIETAEEDEEVNKRLTYLHGMTFKTFFSYKPNFCTVLDTSGSMSGMHEQAAAEMARINKRSEMRLIQIDTEICGDDILKNGELEQSIRDAKFGLKGYGGTYIYKAFERMWQDKTKGTIIVLMSDYELFGDDFDQIDKYTKLLKKRNNSVIHCHLRNNGDVEIHSNLDKLRSRGW